ncbi:hypothetical protein SUDANB121_02929 [Nocardiopsis dassonvillei]|uniref:hypothetical protein n=1 Tax=Nocardiopsis dassonvillei TaxID=2014 RepID=UPI003F544D4A
MKRSEETTTDMPGRRTRSHHADDGAAPVSSGARAAGPAAVPSPAGGPGPDTAGAPGAPGPRTAPDSGGRAGAGPLPDRERVRGRLDAAVNGFVDDPGKAVGEADLVADEVTRALIERIGARRAELRASWEDGGADTERLRLLLRDYRAFVDGVLDGRLV